MRSERHFIMDPNLALYLPLHEPDGDSFTSKDAHGNVCSVNGALWQAEGRVFDAVDDEINLPFKAAKGAKTFLCWVHPGDAIHASNNDVIYGETDATTNSNGNRITWFHDSHRFGWELFKSVAGQFAFQVQSTTGLSKQLWHLALTWDGTTSANAVRLYLNGALDAQATSNVTETQTPTFNARIGDDYYEGSNPNRHYSGLIGDLLVYNRALSPIEIQRLYLTGKQRYQ